MPGPRPAPGSEQPELQQQMAACCTGHCAFRALCGPDEYSSGEESSILAWSALRCVPNVLRVLEVGHRRRGGQREPAPEHARSRQCRATLRTGGLPPPVWSASALWRPRATTGVAVTRERRPALPRSGFLLPSGPGSASPQACREWAEARHSPSRPHKSLRLVCSCGMLHV